MFARLIDDDYAPEVRANIGVLTAARLAANSAYRYLVPFVAVVATGLDVSLAQIGIALTLGELTGLAAPRVARFVDRRARRSTIAGGLVALGMGAWICASAPHLVAFAAGLVLLSVAKMAFDIAVVAWISDHVPLERRGRVIGITETAWALSFLVGVALLGVVTTLTSWRWAYVVVGAAAALAGFVARRRLPAEPPIVHETRTRRSAFPTGAWHFIVAMSLLMLSTQVVFVSIGPWLEDEHGFGAGGLSAVAFVLGAVELAAAAAAVRLTDRWGGRRSVTRGGLLVGPAALGLALGHESLAVGLVAIAVLVLGFEYAIISAVSVATGLVPSSPAAGLALMYTAGTLGRAVGSLAGTWLFEQHGAAAPAFLATAAAVSMALLSSRGRPGSPDARAGRTSGCRRRSG